MEINRNLRSHRWNLLWCISDLTLQNGEFQTSKTLLSIKLNIKRNGSQAEPIDLPRNLAIYMYVYV